MYRCTECDYCLSDNESEYASTNITKNKICPRCGSKIKYTNELIQKYQKYKNHVTK